MIAECVGIWRPWSPRPVPLTVDEIAGFALSEDVIPAALPLATQFKGGLAVQFPNTMRTGAPVIRGSLFTGWSIRSWAIGRLSSRISHFPMARGVSSPEFWWSSRWRSSKMRPPPRLLRRGRRPSTGRELSARRPGPRANSCTCVVCTGARTSCVFWILPRRPPLDSGRFQSRPSQPELKLISGYAARRPSAAAKSRMRFPRMPERSHGRIRRRRRRGGPTDTRTACSAQKSPIP